MKWSSLNQSVEAKVWVVLSGAKCGYEGLSLQPRMDEMVALGRDCVCGGHHDCSLVHGVGGALLAPKPADYVGRRKHWTVIGQHEGEKS